MKKAESGDIEMNGSLSTQVDKDKSPEPLCRLACCISRIPSSTEKNSVVKTEELTDEERQHRLNNLQNKWIRKLSKRNTDLTQEFSKLA